MDKKVQWGVLGAARIALKKVIPAMQRGEWSRVTAIASRDLKKAQQAAEQLQIPKAYGSYEELLADPDVEAVYNALPNHLHVPWTLKGAEAGKHVLCEKPIGLRAEEAIALIRTRNRTGVRIQEAFMVRTHPQWLAALDLIKAGRIGPPRSVLGYFSYCLRDPGNVRNIREYGGGGLMDIGCYLVFASRLVFDAEPSRVIGLIEEEPDLRTDVLTSGILDFGCGQSVFTCSTQMVPYQRIQIFGPKARIEIPIPVNAPPDQPCRIMVDDGAALDGSGAEIMEFPACDQYTIQGDLFSRSILEGTDLAIPLESSMRNMAVIDAMFRSARSGTWETPVIPEL